MVKDGEGLWEIQVQVPIGTKIYLLEEKGKINLGE